MGGEVMKEVVSARGLKKINNYIKDLEARNHDLDSRYNGMLEEMRHCHVIARSAEQESEHYKHEVYSLKNQIEKLKAETARLRERNTELAAIQILLNSHIDKL